MNTSIGIYDMINDQKVLKTYLIWGSKLHFLDTNQLHDMCRVDELVNVSYWAPGAEALVAIQPELI